MPQRAKNPQHRWYFHPVPPPENVLEWSSWPEYSVCIPGPLIAYLLNVMRVYQWDGRVKTDNPAEAKAFVEAWNDLIARIGASVECDPMPYPIFRQNPLNACQMQQSVDGGETWVTVMDASACPPTIPPMIRLRTNPANQYQVQQSHDGGSTWALAFTIPSNPGLTVGDTIYVVNVLEQNLTTITNTYNQGGNTVISIAPNFVYNGIEEEDDVRDILLCWATREVVRLSCEMVIQARNRDAIGMSLASFVLTVVGAVIAATGSVGTGGFGTPFFVALGAGVAGLSATLWAGISNEQLSNETVREKVACCMYNALKGATPERSAFVNSLSGCNFAAGTVEAQMAGAIAASLDSDEMHASWLDYAEQNYRAAQLGLLSDCPCEDEPEERTPVVESLWDPANEVGTLSGPDSEGNWTITSGTRTNDEAFVIRDVDGRPFVLTDLVYEDTPACQVWLLNEALLHIDCGAGNQYTNQTVDELWTTWPAGVHRTTTFKMVAP